MNAGLFERSILNPPQLSTALRELQPLAAEFFKDIYTLEFLGLPTEHSEADLEGALSRNLGRFITELGRDFCFIGSQYPTYSETATVDLNTAIARTEREIALMQEYRTRLTADLVTGKLDVRAAAAHLPAPPAVPTAEPLADELLEEIESADVRVEEE